MQKSRNFLWLIISYSLITATIFDPLKLLGSSMERVSLAFNSNIAIGLVVAFFLGIITKSKILKGSSTLIHEFGHAIAIGLTGGSVHSLRMEVDTSGSTSWSGNPSRFTVALVSIAGPLANAFVLMAVMSALQKGFVVEALFGISAVLVLVLFTSVRNLWGWMISITLVAFLVLLGLVLQGNQILDGWEIPSNVTDAALTAILILVAFNAGIGWNYSWRCRNPKSPDMDEYKFSRTFGLPGWVGGHFIFLIYTGIVFNSVYEVLISKLISN